jgi:subtilisin family serine protease
LVAGAASIPAAAQGLERSYVRQGEDWYRLDAQGTWLVDREVISVRFRRPLRGLGDFQALIPDAAPGAELIAALATLRSNILGVHDLRIPEDADVFDVLQALRASEWVEFAEENAAGVWAGEPDDTLYPQQWALDNDGQTGGTPDADIDADLAWDVSVGVPSVVIAVLDSGVEISHPDLLGGLWKNQNEIPNNGVDDDLNGLVDDYDGWDFLNASPNVAGVVDHGTRTTGVVGARTNNTLGVAGVAGGFNSSDGCRIMPLKVGDNFPIGSVVDDAIIYAVQQGAKVISISFGVVQVSAVDLALDYAQANGVFVTASSGNLPGMMLYPALYPSVVAVASTDEFDNRAPFSIAGPEIEICAPGVVWTTNVNAGYVAGTGNSYSTPQVAGVAGLMLSLLPSLTADEIRLVLSITADDLGPPGWDPEFGWGRLNAFSAVSHVASFDCNGNGIYDGTDISLGASADVNMNGIPDECEPVSFCTAKLNSCAALPAISSTGVALASGGSPHVVLGSNARTGKLGILIYSDQGRRVPAAPFQGGWLCMNQVFRANAVASIGGTPGGCDATYQFDMNQYASGAAGGNPKPFLGVPGTVVEAQWWGRDTVAHGSYLSDALEFTVGP